MSAVLPYWRLSSFYFFYFAAIGVILPYWPLYLQSIQFDAVAIGQLTSILLASKIFAPYVWGWFADHYGQRMRIIRIAGICAVVTYAGVLLNDQFYWLAIVMIVFGFFWHAMLPQFEAVTMNHLGQSTDTYTKVRVWGSIGFILPVVALGFLFEYHDIGLLPCIMLAFLALIFMSSLVTPDTPSQDHPDDHGSILASLKRPPVIALLSACFLMQMSHAPYYTFFTVYLEDYGYSRAFIGNMWGLGVLAEVLVFILMHRLVLRHGLKNLLLLSLLLAALRWLLIGHAVQSVTLLVFAQCLHAASFGIYHATAIQIVHRYFTGRLQGRGQALYSSISFGAGLSLGSLLVGHVWEGVGAATSFSLAALIALLAAAVAWKWVSVREHCEEVWLQESTK